MRFGTAMIGLATAALLAAPACADESMPPEAGFADFIDWLDRNLAAGAEASTTPSPPPAAGEGLLGRLLAANGDAPAEEVAAMPEPAAPSPAVAPITVAAVPVVATPVVTPAAAPLSADGSPFALVSDAERPAAAQSDRSLLLPLN